MLDAGGSTLKAEAKSKAKAKAKAKEKKIETEDDKLKKELRKDCKEFPGTLLVCYGFFSDPSKQHQTTYKCFTLILRLSDRARKAREIALDMNSLKIPHQEACVFFVFQSNGNRQPFCSFVVMMAGHELFSVKHRSKGDG